MNIDSNELYIDDDKLLIGNMDDFVYFIPLSEHWEDKPRLDDVSLELFNIPITTSDKPIKNVLV